MKKTSCFRLKSLSRRRQLWCRDYGSSYMYSRRRSYCGCSLCFWRLVIKFNENIYKSKDLTRYRYEIYMKKDEIIFPIERQIFRESSWPFSVFVLILPRNIYDNTILHKFDDFPSALKILVITSCLFNGFSDILFHFDKRITMKTIIYSAEMFVF